MWSRVLVLTFTLAALTAVSPAQEGEPPVELAPSFKDLIEVSEVLLDVIATDAAGQVVLGLGEAFHRNGASLEATTVGQL